MLPTRRENSHRFQHYGDTTVCVGHDQLLQRSTGAQCGRTTALRSRCLSSNPDYPSCVILSERLNLSFLICRMNVIVDHYNSTLLEGPLEESVICASELACGKCWRKQPSPASLLPAHSAPLALAQGAEIRPFYWCRPCLIRSLPGLKAAV